MNSDEFLIIFSTTESDDLASWVNAKARNEVNFELESLLFGI